MAIMQTNTAQRGGFFAGAAHGIAGVFTAIFDVLVQIAESNSRIKQVERLNAMSDAELEARGINRADIVRHVFRDTFYM